LGSNDVSAKKPQEVITGGFLKRKEVAERFGVSVSTVTRWARMGVIKSVRTPGGHYRFPADSIEMPR